MVQFVCYLSNICYYLILSFFISVDSRIPEVVGESIPMKATFFMTYIMVDGWAGVAAEVLRLKPLVIFHIKNAFLVRTEHDREQAMDPGSLDFYNSEPRLQLYFLLGLVYAVVTPMLLPFIIVFFSLAYLVFRHQVLLSSSLNHSAFCLHRFHVATKTITSASNYSCQYFIWYFKYHALSSFFSYLGP